jgi:hypothetical protein
MTRSMRLTLSSTAAAEIRPAEVSASTFSEDSQFPLFPAFVVLSVFNQFLVTSPPGISRSIPAFTVPAVL